MMSETIFPLPSNLHIVPIITNHPTSTTNPIRFSFEKKYNEVTIEIEPYKDYTSVANSNGDRFLVGSGWYNCTRFNTYTMSFNQREFTYRNNGNNVLNLFACSDFPHYGMMIYGIKSIICDNYKILICIDEQGNYCLFDTKTGKTHYSVGDGTIDETTYEVFKILSVSSLTNDKITRTNYNCNIQIEGNISGSIFSCKFTPIKDVIGVPAANNSRFVFGNMWMSGNFKVYYDLNSNKILGHIVNLGEECDITKVIPDGNNVLNLFACSDFPQYGTMICRFRDVTIDGEKVYLYYNTLYDAPVTIFRDIIAINKVSKGMFSYEIK